MSSSLQPPSQSSRAGFLEMWTGARKTHVAHRRMKIEHVYRPYYLDCYGGWVSSVQKQ
jgi:hypothetical protein